MRHVIIGNGAAGIAAALAIRSRRPADQVDIISDEPHRYYSRVMLTDLIAGTIPEERLFLVGDDFYCDNGLVEHLGCTVKAIEPATKTVQIEGEPPLPFDRLLLAAGAAPNSSGRVEAQSLEGVYTLRTLDDARCIRRRALMSRTALVSGGGMVGLKVAAALTHLGLDVTVVAASRRVFSQVLEAKAAEMLQHMLEESGIRILTGEEIVSVEGQGPQGVRAAVLRSGKRLPCDLVVVGKGVTPRTELARQAGLACGRGILADEYLGTNCPGIYAAGDIAETFDPSLGGRNLCALWPLAVEQGEVAGANMAGDRRPYAGGIPMNSFHWNHISVITLGVSVPRSPEDHALSRLNAKKQTVRQIVFKGSRLAGAALIGDVDGAGLLRALIQMGATPAAGLVESLLHGGLKKAWSRWVMARA